MQARLAGSCSCVWAGGRNDGNPDHAGQRRGGRTRLRRVADRCSSDGDWVNQITAGVLLYRLMTWLLLIPVGMGALGVWRYGVRAAERRSLQRPPPADGEAAR